MVPREAVVQAYRAFLGRDPESEEAILSHQQASDVHELYDRFLGSYEFFLRQPHSFLHWTYQLAAHAPRLAIDVDADEHQLHSIMLRMKRAWTKFGKEHPYFSVLTQQDYSGERIQETRGRFYETGRAETEDLDAVLARNSIESDQLPVCLEFGAGVGRVTVWLAKRFRHVVAVDISAPHLRIAEAACRERNLRNVSFVVLESPELVEAQLPPGYDFLYSRLVLQHNPPPFAIYLLHLLLSRLSAGGAALFQLPTYLSDYKFAVAEYLETPGEGMEMHAVPQAPVFQAAEETGCRILEVFRDASVAGVTNVSSVFVLRKN